ncbi:hypothetical protein ACH4FX_12405 [Streptomyces sp. NPDC018019]|uniref:hypothetical protein n=1 Tax=Streptomyces sp. NPDC018019 TaxID=3365030 RepID=UPI0037AB16B5
MATHLATAVQNAMCDAAVDYVDAGAGVGTIKIYTATMPSSANTAVSSQTLLATFTLVDPAFGSASSGVATLAGTPITTTGAAAGTAAWFRCATSTPGTCFDGTVTATGGGGELQLNTTTISVGVSVEITSGTFTMPSGE